MEIIMKRNAKHIRTFQVSEMIFNAIEDILKNITSGYKCVEEIPEKEVPK